MSGNSKKRFQKSPSGPSSNPRGSRGRFGARCTCVVEMFTTAGSTFSTIEANSLDRCTGFGMARGVAESLPMARETAPRPGNTVPISNPHTRVTNTKSPNRRRWSLIKVLNPSLSNFITTYLQPVDPPSFFHRQGEARPPAELSGACRGFFCCRPWRREPPRRPWPPGTIRRLASQIFRQRFAWTSAPSRLPCGERRPDRCRQLQNAMVIFRFRLVGIHAFGRIDILWDALQAT